MPVEVKKIDAAIFSVFDKIGFLSLPKKYLQNRPQWEVQKDDFLTNKIENPKLTYENLNIERSAKKIKELSALEKIVVVDKASPVVSLAYVPKIKEKILNWKALERTAAADDNGYFELVQRIYGRPEKAIFDLALNLTNKKLEESRCSSNQEEKAAAKKFLDVLPENYQPENIQIQQPTEEEISLVRGQIDREFPELLGMMSDLPDKMFTAAEIKEVFSQALKLMSISDWKVEVCSPNKGSISVNSKQKTIFIPKQRRLRQRQIIPILIHEIGTHLVRSRNGEASPLLLLGRGLDQYETAEEGIATVREQVIPGKPKIFIENLDSCYLAVAWAVGLDGYKRDFRGLYEIMQPYLYWRFVRKKTANPLEKSRTWAWYRCLRVFLGTSGQTKGACFTRDIMYRRGHLMIWNLVKNKPKEISRFNVGKYDPKNEAHLKILDLLKL